LAVEHHARARIVNERLQFTDCQALVDYVQDRPQLVAGEQRIQVRDAVHGADRHPVAFASPQPIPEEVGELVGLVVLLLVGDWLVAVDGINEGDLVRRQHLPPL